MSWSDRIQTAQRRPLLFAWAVFTLYGICACAIAQLIVLPYILPGIHAGHGLLAGGDFPGLHEIAIRMTSKIEREGWSAWELLPGGHSAAGVAGAIYALTYPEPWVLIPFNAGMHALGGLIIMRLIQILTANTPLSFWCAALYVAFPSSLHWVSQIQKDSTYFAGMLAVLLGLVALIHAASKKAQLSEMAVALGFLLLGFLLTGVARLYGFELIRGAAGLIAVLIAPSIFLRWRTKDIPIGRLGMVAALVITVVMAGKYLPHEKRIEVELPPVAAANASTQPKPTFLDSSKAQNALELVFQWQRNELLPDGVDHAIMRLAVARRGWSGPSYATAGSKIDTDVEFISARQFAQYFPRALQVGFLTPFPEHWFAPGASPGGTIMRRVVGLEMLILYPILLVGLPLAAWRWRRRVEFWMIVTFCTPIIVAYTYVMPNMGALYRIRYGFLMCLAAIGLAAIWLNLQTWRANPKQTSAN